MQKEKKTYKVDKGSHDKLLPIDLLKIFSNTSRELIAIQRCYITNIQEDQYKVVRNMCNSSKAQSKLVICAFFVVPDEGVVLLGLSDVELLGC